MGVTPASSGDLAADRRYGYARDLLQEGDAAAAADLFRQVLELAPGWPAAWFGLGEACEAAGDPAGAVEAYGRVLSLAPEDPLGALPRLARLGAGQAAMTPAYVAALFDEYAPRFEAHLTKALAYRGPEILCDVLATAAPGRRFAEAMDLGCGTGLMAEAIRDRVGAIDGVDVSAAMVSQARRRGIYRDLAAGEMAAALDGGVPARYDLVLAADVLVYVGDCAPLFAAVARALRPGGHFAFTTQSCEGDGCIIGEDLRFHQSPSYIRRMASETGFDVRAMAECVVRMDRGQPCAGHGFVLGQADG
jgi:predicted TPR repeat methyltransferase